MPTDQANSNLLVAEDSMDLESDTGNTYDEDTLIDVDVEIDPSGDMVKDDMMLDGEQEVNQDDMMYDEETGPPLDEESMRDYDEDEDIQDMDGGVDETLPAQHYPPTDIFASTSADYTTHADTQNNVDELTDDEQDPHRYLNGQDASYNVDHAPEQGQPLSHSPDGKHDTVQADQTSITEQNDVSQERPVEESQAEYDEPEDEEHYSPSIHFPLLIRWRGDLFDPFSAAAGPKPIGGRDICEHPVGLFMPALRTLLEDEIHTDCELKVRFECLQLTVRESTVDASCSLADINDIYMTLCMHDGNQDPKPLILDVDEEQTFTGRFRELHEAIEHGRGLGEVTKDNVDGNKGEKEIKDHSGDEEEGTSATGLEPEGTADIGKGITDDQVEEEQQAKEEEIFAGGEKTEKEGTENTPNIGSNEGTSEAQQDPQIAPATGVVSPVQDTVQPNDATLVLDAVEAEQGGDTGTGDQVDTTTRIKSDEPVSLPVNDEVDVADGQESRTIKPTEPVKSVTTEAEHTTDIGIDSFPDEAHIPAVLSVVEEPQAEPADESDDDQYPDEGLEWPEEVDEATEEQEHEDQIEVHTEGDQQETQEHDESTEYYDASHELEDGVGEDVDIHAETLQMPDLFEQQKDEELPEEPAAEPELEFPEDEFEDEADVDAEEPQITLDTEATEPLVPEVVSEATLADPEDATEPAPRGNPKAAPYLSRKRSLPEHEADGTLTAETEQKKARPS